MYIKASIINFTFLFHSARAQARPKPCSACHDTSWGEPERAPHRRDIHARIVYWGEPERAPHRRDIHARIVYIYIYICMYGTTVTRGAAHTQYTVCIPKYSAQYRPHVVMFASSTAQACNIHCHVFKHRSSYVCAFNSSNRDR